MWSVFKDLIFYVIQFFYNFLGSMSLGDWGLAIIIVTIIFRALITPLMFKQTQSSFQMQKVQPLMKQIQEKYADDPVRQKEEMQKLYAEAKFNPLAGCLPMLFQMPIFIALFQVLREMGTRTQGSDYRFFNIVPNLVTTPNQAFTSDDVSFIPYVTLMILFAGATFIPMVLLQKNNKDPQQKQQTLMMSGIMSIFMLWVGWRSPAGVLLFWGTSSLISIAQQQISLAILRHRDKNSAELVIDIEPTEVAVVRKEKKPRPTKKR